MARKFKLDKDLMERIAALETDLREAADEFRAEWDEERSERWQESDKGIAADAWIDALYEVADALEGVPEEPEE